MKSLVQEASSVAKAIEKAWVNAGKPKSFSIKIFEEPKKNFFGFTVKPAKVGIFFHDHEEAKPSHADHRAHGREKMHKPKERMDISKKTDGYARKETPHHTRAEHGDGGAIWTPEMIDKASQWLREALAAMELSHINYTNTTDRYLLTFTFNAPLVANADQERQLLRSFSFLMLQALKRTFKRPLRGFKVSLVAHQS